MREQVSRVANLCGSKQTNCSDAKLANVVTQKAKVAKVANDVKLAIVERKSKCKCKSNFANVANVVTDRKVKKEVFSKC